MESKCRELVVQTDLCFTIMHIVHSGACALSTRTCECEAGYFGSSCAESNIQINPGSRCAFCAVLVYSAAILTIALMTS
jgi:hypothetical protein